MNLVYDKEVLDISLEFSSQVFSSIIFIGDCLKSLFLNRSLLYFSGVVLSDFTAFLMIIESFVSVQDTDFSCLFSIL